MSASIYVSEQINRQLVNISQELAYKAVNYCAEKYNFNAEEVYRALGLGLIKVERSKKVKSEKGKSLSSPKARFPLPYNGEENVECCSALRQNNGLYTQCQGARHGSSNFCKGCVNQMQKTGAEVPEYGTIQMRKAVGIFEYIDPKGRKPVAYTKVMKKYKLTQEEVEEEAGNLNIVINRDHFVVPEESKRGRPSKEKEVKEKMSRGRPKKTKKVVELEDTEDLFATLVANANEVEKEVEKEEDVVIKKKEESDKKGEKEQKKEAERQAREAKKKAEEEEKAAQKAAKEAEKEAAKKEKEEKLAAEKAAKEAAKKEKESAKKEKEAAKKEKEATKASKKQTPTKEAVVEEDEEPDVVKKIEFEGKKYLKSKKSGIIYDYNEYTKNGEQVVVGKWNVNSNKIDFNLSKEEDEEEEEEEEYDQISTNM
jgi:hypothetical protein